MFFFRETQGRIAAANVLSDLYAMGVADCDNMLMLLCLWRRSFFLLKKTITQHNVNMFDNFCTTKQHSAWT